ncbi:MAG: cytochrome P450, partial [Patescibacteria group bacterium]
TLLTHDRLSQVLGAPGVTGRAVEELLRYEGLLEMATERYARVDVAMADVVIPRGSRVHAVLASANRDEVQFPDPDRLDLSREPNRHVAFGHGIHFCAGAALARLEGQIALTTLAQRCPDLRLTQDPASLTWRRGLIMRGVEHLPVAFSPQ